MGRTYIEYCQDSSGGVKHNSLPSRFTYNMYAYVRPWCITERFPLHHSRALVRCSREVLSCPVWRCRVHDRAGGIK